MKKELNGHQELIRKPEIQFWTPIIATFITVTIWGMTLLGRIDIVVYRIGRLESEVIERTAENQDRLDKYVISLNKFSERLTRIE